MLLHFNMFLLWQFNLQAWGGTAIETTIIIYWIRIAGCSEQIRDMICTESNRCYVYCLGRLFKTCSIYSSVLTLFSNASVIYQWLIDWLRNVELHCCLQTELHWFFFILLSIWYITCIHRTIVRNCRAKIIHSYSFIQCADKVTLNLKQKDQKYGKPLKYF
jgi:hypothetical protein